MSIPLSCYLIHQQNILRKGFFFLFKAKSTEALLISIDTKFKGFRCYSFSENIFYINGQRSTAARLIFFFKLDKSSLKTLSGISNFNQISSLSTKNSLALYDIYDTILGLVKPFTPYVLCRAAVTL